MLVFLFDFIVIIFFYPHSDLLTTVTLTSATETSSTGVAIAVECNFQHSAALE